MKVLSIFFLFFILYLSAYTNHTVKLNLPNLDDLQVQLYLYQGFDKKLISKTKTDENGVAELTYPANFRGAGVIKIAYLTESLIILGEEKIQVTLTESNDQQKINIHSDENKLLDDFLSLYQLNEAKLSGLKWLKPLYHDDKKRLKNFQNEINNVKKNTQEFIADIPEDFFISYYIPIRIFIEQIPASLNQYWQRVPQHIEQFHTIDFSDKRLYNSGLAGSLLQNYVILCESAGSGTPDLDSVYVLLNAATDHILSTVEGDDELTNLYSKQLFQLFESRSLFRASEYLSLKVLDSACELESGLERRLEQYRKMQTGNPAPEIYFEKPVKGKNKLSEIESEYKLVVFWATWCKHCMEEIPQLYEMYEQLKNHNVEVVAVSLDHSQKVYRKIINRFSWYNYSDFNGWESQSAIDYHVFATPTYYMLDNEHKIYWKINSVEHLKAVINLLFEK